MITVEYITATGLGLTMYLYPLDSDTVVNVSGHVLTEASNRKGIYRGTVTESISGWYTAHIKVGANLLDVVYVYINSDNTTSRCETSPSFHLIKSAQLVGPGGKPVTLTVEDHSDIPIVGVQIWITTDQAGLNIIAGTLVTDDFGHADFLLDSGSYYSWRKKPGYSFTNPQIVTVP